MSGQTRFVRGRGTSAVRSISDIGARVCQTAAVVNVIFGVGQSRLIFAAGRRVLDWH